MWIMSDTGFISVVQHRDNPDVLLVRARVKEDIHRVFGPDVEVKEQPGADYLYRANISRERVANVMWEKMMTLDYTSHAKDVAIKRSAPAEGRSKAYYAMWTAMAAIQPYAPYSMFPRGQEPTITYPTYPAAPAKGKKGKKGKGKNNHHAVGRPRLPWWQDAEMSVTAREIADRGIDWDSWEWEHDIPVRSQR